MHVNEVGRIYFLHVDYLCRLQYYRVLFYVLAASLFVLCVQDACY